MLIARRHPASGCRRTFVLAQPPCSGGDEQCLEARSAETAASRPRNQQIDDHRDLTVRIIARHATAIDVCAPEEAFAVDRGTITDAAFLGDGCKQPTIRDVSSLDIEVINNNLARERIGEVHPTIIWAPTDPVVHSDVGCHLVRGMVGIETP